MADLFYREPEKQRSARSDASYIHWQQELTSSSVWLYKLYLTSASVWYVFSSAS